jgi:hypothetical protein
MPESPSNQEQQVQSDRFEGFNPSYETLRDNLPVVPQPVRERWQRSDRLAHSLQESYSSVAADEDYTDEARSRKAAELHERQAPKIEEERQAIRKELQDAAAAVERMSIPRPAGQPLVPRDTASVAVMQAERARIIAAIERQGNSRGPFQARSSDYLRSEYKRGTDIEGVHGNAICQGVREAARELGIGQDWLDSLRSDEQRKSSDDARLLEMAAFSVPSKAPQPPKSLQKAARVQRDTNMRRPVFMPRPEGSDEAPMVASEPAHSSTGRKRKRQKSWE